jgi:hypothetical protein
MLLVLVELLDGDLAPAVEQLILHSQDARYSVQAPLCLRFQWIRFLLRLVVRI